MRTIPVLWFFFIPFCFINLSTNIFFVNGQYCVGHQESSLLHFKNSLLFNPTKSKKLVHWNQSYDCCQWNGITCSKGRVIALDLSGEFISGRINASSSLFDLQSLQNLNLAYNDFEGQIPESFASLTNLTTLKISSCNLSGEFPRQIFQISNLEVLDLSDNPNLHGSLPNFPRHGSLEVLNISHTSFSGELPYSIHNLRKLSTLDLSNCRFNGTLPSQISELTELVHLDFSFNNFTGPLPSFNKSKGLTYLSFYQNDLKGVVPSSHFEGLENLTYIDLAGNSLNGRIPSSLFTLPSLQKLMLSYNRFQGVLDEFPNASSSMLEFLDINGNNLEGPIPESVFHLERLRLLNLGLNYFNGSIKLDVISRMGNLVALDLSYNNLSIDTTLRDDNYDLSSSSFPKLKNLRLASCRLSEFPSFLRNQSSLLQLDLSMNQIHGTIPNWIWRFDFLFSFNLSNNFFTDLEGPFHNISSNLVLLDLHSNQLKGSAPILSKSLFYLDYSSNRFNYIAPQEIANHLSFVFFLSLSNNSFHGKIHESFCNISTLKVLDLSDNSFNGNIPECLITRMSSTIRALILGGNNLKTQISNTFPISCDLRFLDLNGNFLQGSIPKSLGNCQKLQVLNLGNNQLTDRFPCFLRNISTLRVLILRSNNFHGTLECPNNNGIGNWETLQIVDLASNNFSGSLPVMLLQSWKALMLDENDEASPLKFGNLVFDLSDNLNISVVDFKSVFSLINTNVTLKVAQLLRGISPFLIDHMLFDGYFEKYSFRSYQGSVSIVNKGIQLKLVKIFTAFTSLDFSSNHFKGSIPEEVMSFKALHALNLSHNSFSGNIPSSIRNLKYLESLDLSVNSFSGNIPIELASLSFLSFLNLSYNHLVGRIPTGTQIQSFEADSFEGNEGLFGPPLTQNHNRGVQEVSRSDSGSSIDWNFLSAELGFTFGVGIVILPLLFWTKWRMQYFKCVDNMLYKIVPWLDFIHENRGGKIYRSLRWKPY